MTTKPSVAYPQTLAQCHAMITRLSDAYDELQATYAFEYFDNRDAQDAVLFRLTHAEGVLLSALSSGITQSSEELLFRLERAGKESKAENPYNVLRVMVLRLRKKLVPYGAAILNHQGYGYRVEGLAQARINCANGDVLHGYVPDQDFNPKRKQVTWAIVKPLLAEHGSMSIRQIRMAIGPSWRREVAAKDSALRRILERAVAEGRAQVAQTMIEKWHTKVWYLSNTTVV